MQDTAAWREPTATVVALSNYRCCCRQGRRQRDATGDIKSTPKERSRAFALTLVGRQPTHAQQARTALLFLPTAKHTPGQTCDDGRERAHCTDFTSDQGRPHHRAWAGRSDSKKTGPKQGQPRGFTVLPLLWCGMVAVKSTLRFRDSLPSIALPW